jgi:hypothetical protein
MKPSFLVVAFAPEQRVRSFLTFSRWKSQGQRQMGFAIPNRSIPAARSQSRRYVPLTERVKGTMQVRKQGANEGWVFPSKQARSAHITDREVSQQRLEVPSNWRVFPKEWSCTVLAVASQRMPWEDVHWVEFSGLTSLGVHET